MVDLPVTLLHVHSRFAFWVSYITFNKNTLEASAQSRMDSNNGHKTQDENNLETHRHTQHVKQTR